MPHPTRLSKAHMAQLKAGIDRRVAGVKSKIDNAMDTIESRAEKVKVLRHGMLRRQLSFFSVPPEDREDPIPHTNVFLGVLYVLGAVAALCFALIDSSCEEVTAYREDAPIDTCTEMLASFSCRTADYNRTAGTGFSKIFDKTTCLEGRNATEEKFGKIWPSPGWAVRVNERGRVHLSDLGIRQHGNSKDSHCLRELGQD